MIINTIQELKDSKQTINIDDLYKMVSKDNNNILSFEPFILDLYNHFYLSNLLTLNQYSDYKIGNDINKFKNNIKAGIQQIALAYQLSTLILNKIGPTFIDCLQKYNFDKAMKFTLQWEGGYVSNPYDYGGTTNYGITQYTYDNYRKKNARILQNVIYIDKKEVNDLYYNEYYIPSKCPQLFQPLAIVVFDTAVNFGISGAIEFIQEVMNIKITGKWNDETIHYLFKNNNLNYANKIIEHRITYRKQRVQKDDSQQIFLKGWLNRDNALKQYINK